MEKIINYVKGDATEPKSDTDKKIIVHVCNNIGGWGAGFVLALSKKWPEPESRYRSMLEYTLGDIDVVKVGNGIEVCNMIAQEGTISRMSDNPLLPPIRYVAVEVGLSRLRDYIVDQRIKGESVSVHMPMIGSGLAGGNWNIIEAIVEEVLVKHDINVTVYQFD